MECEQQVFFRRISPTPAFEKTVQTRSLNFGRLSVWFALEIKPLAIESYLQLEGAVFSNWLNARSFPFDKFVVFSPFDALF